MDKKVKIQSETITKDKEVVIKDCVALGISNFGDTVVFFDGMEVPPNASLPLPQALNTVLDQSFDVRFVGTGTKKLLVIKTILQHECN